MVAVRDEVAEVVGGGTWVLLGGLAVSLAGFVFWLVLSRLVGVESVGIASAIVSASGVASTLVSAGLNIAVIREVAAEGPKAFTTSLLLALVLGSVAAVVTVPLTYSLGYGSLASFASALALLSIMSIAAAQSLMGFEEFRKYFTAMLTSSIAKIAVGVALAVAGLSVLSPIIGYLTYPLVLLIAALLLALPVLKCSEDLRPSVAGFKSLVKLSLSNYPYVFSNQLLTMLGVYIFAYLVREAVPTGTLYIDLMISLAVAAIPGSILSAALPVSIRKGADTFAESFRVGLSLATPVVVLVGGASTALLSTINPDLTAGSLPLKVLLTSVAPLTALTAAIMALNKKGNAKEIAVLGLTRLTVLTALLPVVSNYFGLLGASLAYLLANIAPLPIARRYVKIWNHLAVLWTIQTALILMSIPLSSYVSELSLALALAAASILVMHVTRAYTIRELAKTIEIIATHILK